MKADDSRHGEDEDDGKLEKEERSKTAEHSRDDDDQDCQKLKHSDGVKGIEPHNDEASWATLEDSFTKPVSHIQHVVQYLKKRKSVLSALEVLDVASHLPVKDAQCDCKGGHKEDSKIELTGFASQEDESKISEQSGTYEN